MSSDEDTAWAQGFGMGMLCGVALMISMSIVVSIFASVLRWWFA